jgi:hypothetical protein
LLLGSRFFFWLYVYQDLGDPIDLRQDKILDNVRDYVSCPNAQVPAHDYVKIDVATSAKEFPRNPTRHLDTANRKFEAMLISDECSPPSTCRFVLMALFTTTLPN